MALHSWLGIALVALLGSSDARSAPEGFSRALLQSEPISAMCGSQGYIVGESLCVIIPTATGVAAWICPVDQRCACPTTVTGRNPFSCYDPSVQSCSTTSPNWPKSGLINTVGASDAGACGSLPLAPALAPAPVPAPAPGPAPAGVLSASAPISEPAPTSATSSSG